MSLHPSLWLDGLGSLASTVLSSCECNPSWVWERRGCTFSTLFLLGCYNGVLPHRLNLLGFSQDRDELSPVHFGIGNRGFNINRAPNTIQSSSVISIHLHRMDSTALHITNFTFSSVADIFEAARGLVRICGLVHFCDCPVSSSYPLIPCYTHHNSHYITSAVGYHIGLFGSKSARLLPPSFLQISSCLLFPTD